MTSRLDATQAYPHIRVLDMSRVLAGPLAGQLMLRHRPIHFTGAPIRYGLPPPLLGQHTREVLGDVLGLDKARIDRLVAQGPL